MIFGGYDFRRRVERRWSLISGMLCRAPMKDLEGGNDKSGNAGEGDGGLEVVSSSGRGAVEGI